MRLPKKCPSGLARCCVVVWLWVAVVPFSSFGSLGRLGADLLAQLGVFTRELFNALLGGIAGLGLEFLFAGILGRVALYGLVGLLLWFLLSGFGLSVGRSVGCLIFSCRF